MCAATIASVVLSLFAAQAAPATPARAETTAPPSASSSGVATTGSSVPAAEKPSARSSSGALAIDVEFLESSGVTLAERHVRLSLGTPETISVQQGNRTVLLETTVRAGAKTGCHKIDVTLRDRRIDASGRFEKTVWQSTSEPCTATPFVLGPKEETRIKVALKPAN